MPNALLTQCIVSRSLLTVIIGMGFGTLLSGCGNNDSAPEEVAAESTSAPVATLPPIRVTPGVLNWGDVLPGETSDGSVALTNMGTTPLKIITVQPGCKCTTTNGLDGAVIAPGESRDLVASLDAQPCHEV